MPRLSKEVRTFDEWWHSSEHLLNVKGFYEMPIDAGRAGWNARDAEITHLESEKAELLAASKKVVASAYSSDAHNWITAMEELRAAIQHAEAPNDRANDARRAVSAASSR